MLVLHVCSVTQLLIISVADVNNADVTELVYRAPGGDDMPCTRGEGKLANERECCAHHKCKYVQICSPNERSELRGFRALYDEAPESLLLDCCCFQDFIT